jgi:hypothetical protein
MRLGLGLGFLHRVAKTVVVAVAETFFLLQEDGDFLMLEDSGQIELEQ